MRNHFISPVCISPSCACRAGKAPPRLQAWTRPTGYGSRNRASGKLISFARHYRLDEAVHVTRRGRHPRRTGRELSGSASRELGISRSRTSGFSSLSPPDICSSPTVDGPLSCQVRYPPSNYAHSFSFLDSVLAVLSSTLPLPVLCRIRRQTCLLYARHVRPSSAQQPQRTRSQHRPRGRSTSTPPLLFHLSKASRLAAPRPAPAAMTGMRAGLLPPLHLRPHKPGTRPVPWGHKPTSLPLTGIRGPPRCTRRLWSPRLQRP